MDASSILKLAVLVVTTSVFFQYCIRQNAREANEAWHHLCGGRLNFVYGSHPTLGTIFLADTEAYNLTRAANLLPNMRPLVEDVVFNYQGQAEKSMWRKGRRSAAKHVNDLLELRAWMTMSAREAGEQYGSGSRSYGRPVERCEDAPWAGPAVYFEADWTWGTLHALTGASSCQEARPFCDAKELPLVRMLCPVTCGCTDISSGLFASIGCNQRCLNTTEFQESRNATGVTEAAWRRWWRGFHMSNGKLWDPENEMMQFGRATEALNCSFVASKQWIQKEFCSSKDHRPGTAFCPSECGCEISNSKWCPLAKC